MSNLIVTNIGMLATPQGKGPKKGPEQGDIKILNDAWVLIKDGVIAGVGQGKLPERYDNLDLSTVKTIDAQGKLVTPGLVDAHTHLIFGGWQIGRAHV